MACRVAIKKKSVKQCSQLYKIAFIQKALAQKKKKIKNFVSPANQLIDHQKSTDAYTKVGNTGMNTKVVIFTSSSSNHCLCNTKLPPKMQSSKFQKILMNCFPAWLPT